MNTNITVQGLVATTPRHIVTADGLPITSFRLASSQRKFDQVNNRWIDGETNWYTVTSTGQLAVNAAGSIGKGDRLVVAGKLHVRDWDNGERAGTSVEIEAETIGHDMAWGSSTFERTVLVREQAHTEETIAEPYRTAEGVMTDGVPHSCTCSSCDR